MAALSQEPNSIFQEYPTLENYNNDTTNKKFLLTSSFTLKEPMHLK